MFSLITVLVISSLCSVYYYVTRHMLYHNSRRICGMPPGGSHPFVFNTGEYHHTGYLVTKYNKHKYITNINTSKRHFHRPVANLSCFQKGASYCGIKIFKSLPRSIRSLKSEKTQFGIAWKKCLYTHSFYSVDGFFACTDNKYC